MIDKRKLTVLICLQIDRLPTAMLASLQILELILPLTDAGRRPCAVVIFLPDSHTCRSLLPRIVRYPVKIIIIAGRRPCPSGTCCSGFSVLRCLGRACTLVAPTLLAFARRVEAPSQALKNAPLAAFFTAPPSHPPAQLRVQGANAAKTLTQPRRSTGNQDRALSGSLYQAG